MARAASSSRAGRPLKPGKGAATRGAPRSSRNVVAHRVAAAAAAAAAVIVSSRLCRLGRPARESSGKQTGKQAGEPARRPGHPVGTSSRPVWPRYEEPSGAFSCPGSLATLADPGLVAACRARRRRPGRPPHPSGLGSRKTLSGPLNRPKTVRPLNQHQSPETPGLDDPEDPKAPRASSEPQSRTATPRCRSCALAGGSGGPALWSQVYAYRKPEKKRPPAAGEEAAGQAGSQAGREPGRQPERQAGRQPGSSAARQANKRVRRLGVGPVVAGSHRSDAQELKV